MYSHLIRPLLFACDPEWAHHQMIGLARGVGQCTLGQAMAKALFCPSHSEKLKQTRLGIDFQHPVGLAAGFDKNAEILPVLQALGLAFVEVGSISAQPSSGNPTPRVFRLPEDTAVINRMGLNNDGVQVISSRLKDTIIGWPVGISISKTHDPNIVGDLALKDYEATLRGVFGLGAYISLNISCPNTKEGKTFEDPDALDALLEHLRAVEAQCANEMGLAPRPWLLKVSPDVTETQLKTLFEIGTRHHVAGWIATNTSRSREGLVTSSSRIESIGMGGLSGQPIQQASSRVLGWLYQWGQTLVVPPVLIGVGGIVDGASAWEKITHGADLVQVYTGLIYQGPGLVRALCQDLEARCKAEGFTHLSQAVGSAFRNNLTYSGAVKS